MRKTLSKTLSDTKIGVIEKSRKFKIDNENRLAIRYNEPFNLLSQNYLNGYGARDRT